MAAWYHEEGAFGCCYVEGPGGLAICCTKQGKVGMAGLHLRRHGQLVHGAAQGPRDQVLVGQGPWGRGKHSDRAVRHVHVLDLQAAAHTPPLSMEIVRPASASAVFSCLAAEGGRMLCRPHWPPMAPVHSFGSSRHMRTHLSTHIQADTKWTLHGKQLWPPWEGITVPLPRWPSHGPPPMVPLPRSPSHGGHPWRAVMGALPLPVMPLPVMPLGAPSYAPNSPLCPPTVGGHNCGHRGRVTDRAAHAALASPHPPSTAALLWGTNTRKPLWHRLQYSHCSAVHMFLCMVDVVGASCPPGFDTQKCERVNHPNKLPAWGILVLSHTAAV